MYIDLPMVDTNCFVFKSVCVCVCYVYANMLYLLQKLFSAFTSLTNKYSVYNQFEFLHAATENIVGVCDLPE